MSAAAPLQEAPSEATAVKFLLTADAEPGLLPRLLLPFAKRDLIPDRFSATCTGDTIEVEIAMAAMPIELIHLVEGNLRQIIGLRRLARLG
jgi:hypothetical protein